MQKYPFEKYFYKNKDKIITNLKVNAHELYLIDRALAAENIKIGAVIDAQKENEEIIFLINKELPRHKNLYLTNKEIIAAMEKQIEESKHQIEEKIHQLKLDNIEPGANLDLLYAE